MVRLVALFILLFLTGCRFWVGIPQEETPAPPPTPLICTPLPENMTFVVTPLSHTSLHIAMTGLQAGEIPVIRVQTQTMDGSLDLTETSTQPLDSSGQYDHTVYNLELDSRQPPSWHVIVTHAQGVACVAVTLP